ncbi:MAG TPA: SDR family NAD(P)-dependent oxidoreductase [Trebonia sp.]
MNLEGLTTAVTGGASGLDLATARHLVEAGGYVTIVDLPGSAGAEMAKDLGDRAQFSPADVTDETAFAAALDAADTQAGGLRGLVHCAGGGRRLRVLEKDGSPGSLATSRPLSGST